MNWLEIASKMVEQNNDGVKIAPLSNIAGADIKFDKGYGSNKLSYFLKNPLTIRGFSVILWVQRTKAH